MVVSPKMQICWRIVSLNGPVHWVAISLKIIGKYLVQTKVLIPMGSFYRIFYLSQRPFHRMITKRTFVWPNGSFHRITYISEIWKKVGEAIDSTKRPIRWNDPISSNNPLRRRWLPLEHLSSDCWPLLNSSKIMSTLLAAASCLLTEAYWSGSIKKRQNAKNNSCPERICWTGGNTKRRSLGLPSLFQGFDL